MCLAQEPQRSDAGEARTRGLSVSSKALYHWATATRSWFDLLYNWPPNSELLLTNSLLELIYFLTTPVEYRKVHIIAKEYRLQAN